MTIFTGCYVALGTGVSNTGVFTECTTYTRGTATFTGTALSGLTQALSQITGPTGPVGGSITYGALFDALTGGNCLAYWNWNVLTAVPANFLAVTLNVNFLTNIQVALNLSLIGGAATSGSTIDQGAQLGTMIGNPMIAGCKLGIQNGFLVAQNASNRIIDANGGTIQYQSAGSNIGGIGPTGLVYGSVAAGQTAKASGTQSTGVPVTTSVSQFTTVATSLDSSVLPVCAAGTVIAISNTGGSASMALYPDLGSTINVASANAALVIPTAKSCLLVRVSSSAWISIPTVPT